MPDELVVKPSGGPGGRGVRVPPPGGPGAGDLQGRRSAVRFLPQRALGWNIALTDQGPRIVEANSSHDPWPSAAFGDVVGAMGRVMASGGRAEVQGGV